LLREALRAMGRADLIGNGKKHLVPSFQPPGTGLRNRQAAPATADYVHAMRSTKSPRRKGSPGTA
jgi:hypothetical protein